MFLDSPVRFSGNRGKRLPVETEMGAIWLHLSGASWRGR